jgi:hypothetical protein
MGQLFQGYDLPTLSNVMGDRDTFFGGYLVKCLRYSTFQDRNAAQARSEATSRTRGTKWRQADGGA